MDPLFKRVRCSVHHGTQKDYLSIDPKTFQIKCTLCEKENQKTKNRNLIFIDQEILNQEEFDNQLKGVQPVNDVSNHFCYKHDTEPSLFYCEECAQFLCKTCFATEHRNHSSSTFDLIAEVIKEKVNTLYNNLETLNNNLDNNYKALEEKNKYFEETKNNFETNLATVNKKINDALENKVKDYDAQIQNFFNGVDKEVDSNLEKLESTRSKANRMIEEFTKMKEEVANIAQDTKVCLYKKEKDQTISENRQFLLDIEAFLREHLIQTKEKAAAEEQNFKEKCENLKKNIDIYEKSVISTMKSGIPNVCSRIRRFCRYSLDKSKFFKNDSLCMMVSQSVNLAGFALCGLFHEQEQAITTYKVNLKLYELTDVKNYNKDSKEMFSIDVDIPSITNCADPVYQFYLENSFLLDKDKFYFIILSNVSSQTFVTTWSGSIYRDKNATNTNQNNIIISNNNNVKFTFINAFGVESDFNEFSSGLISDVIYSPLE